MLCSISGTVPEEPVVSSKSGHLYEKQLVLKIIKETGRDPVTDEPLEESELLPLGVGKAAHPRPTPATSIPGLLALFQNEWDATMLEMHALRQALHATRQELAHALYQHDAATRVVSRTLRERDAALAERDAALVEGGGGGPARRARAEAEAEEEEGSAKRARPALPAAALEALSASSAELSAARKKRALPATVAEAEALRSLELLDSHALHKTRRGGVAALACAPRGRGEAVASAGGDHSVAVFDAASKQLRASLKGHEGAVAAVKLGRQARLVLSGAADATVRLWRAGEGEAEAEGSWDYECAATLGGLSQDPVAAVALHPCEAYALSGAAGGAWGLWDLDTQALLTRQAEGEASLRALELHPDGLVLCTAGARGTLAVWETRSQKSVAALAGHAGPVNALAFSENGYHLASAGEDGVRVWDLRKQRQIAAWEEFAGARAVQFDLSGLFLAMGGERGVQVAGTKQSWGVLARLPAGALHKGAAAALAWGADAKTLYVGGGDHNLRVFRCAQ